MTEMDHKVILVKLEYLENKLKIGFNWVKVSKEKILEIYLEDRLILMIRVIPLSLVPIKMMVWLQMQGMQEFINLMAQLGIN